jgi:asparagine synthase (glutamine-hydrolysing)
MFFNRAMPGYHKPTSTTVKTIQLLFNPQPVKFFLPAACVLPAERKKCPNMCGIAGIIDFRGRPVDPGDLQRFCHALGHRGPDDTGTWIQHIDGFSVGLAHTRLAVIDPHPEAAQPMADPQNRCAVTYNGELYNYRSLQKELSATPRTQSDTEIALLACMEWGPRALEKFDAMWAMGFVDTEKRTGHLSRDPFGIKPLYYAYFDNRLIFASELPALAGYPHLQKEIDSEALAIYLNLGYIPHPKTIYRHIYKLPPGHLLRFDQDGPAEPEPYFQLPGPPESPPDYVEACGELRRRILQAVDRQTVADVPLGAFLSGGVDSAIITAALVNTGHKVKTFSIGYRHHPRYDETRYARLAADYLGTEHHVFPLEFDQILDTIEPCLAHLGEPFADSSLLPTALVSQQTRRHVTVALSGDGGDELFGGYWRYFGHHYLDRYRRLPALLRRGLIEPLLQRLPSARSTPLLDRLRQARKLLRGNYADPMDRHLAWVRHLDDRLAAELIGPQQAHAAAAYIRERYINAAGQFLSDRRRRPAGLEAILLADLAIGLPADMLWKVDTASMMHSLEVRVPFLSPDVANFAANLPTDYKIRGGTGKHVLRDAFAEDLPPEILQRRKMGFEVPVGEFLRNELKTIYQDTVTGDLLNTLGLAPAIADRLFNEHQTRRHDHADLLWALFVLCSWYRRNF